MVLIREEENTRLLRTERGDRIKTNNSDCNEMCEKEETTLVPVKDTVLRGDTGNSMSRVPWVGLWL